MTKKDRVHTEGVGTASQDVAELMEEFIGIARRAVDLGIQTGTGGNISMRAGPDYFVKASGSSLYGMAGKDIVVVDRSGRVLSGAGRPTKEIKFHLGIYRTREDVGGIVHYHAPFATAFAVKGLRIPALTLHAKRNFSKMPVIPELQDGSQELADAVVRAFEDREVRLILLVSHGIVAVGETLADAQALAELAEETAKIAIFARFLDVS
jgi:L-ribulose-5-phosphate 4-epimerase